MKSNCLYCFREFANKQNLNSHLNICREKDDDVRQLETQLQMDIEQWNRYECRFCNRYASSAPSLVRRHQTSCKARKIYKAHLEHELKEQQPSTHAQTIINNTVNNINVHVNSLGQENYDYITKRIIQNICGQTETAQEFFAKTLVYIHAHPKHPENHNIIYTNHRSNMALVKWKDEFEYRPIHTIIQKAANNMLDKVCIDDVIDKLPLHLKQKYETVSENDELDQKTSSLFKLDLYSKHKKGNISALK